MWYRIWYGGPARHAGLAGMAAGQMAFFEGPRPAQRPATAHHLTNEFWDKGHSPWRTYQRQVEATDGV